jgi:ATP-binding cassette subfamily F protein uup
VTTESSAPTASLRRRLTYKEQQELAALPATIERLETEIAAMHAAMAAPDFYRAPGEQIVAEQLKLSSLQEQLTTAFRRWEELEDKA